MKRIAEPPEPSLASSRDEGSPPVREAPVAEREPQREAPSAPEAVAPAPVLPAEVPLGYVVASGFFFAIAVVGFGLWLAFEVISL